MKATRTTACLLAGLVGLAGCASQGLARRSAPVSAAPAVPRLTKEDVIALAAAKVSDRVIISQIQASGSHFALAAQDLVDLTNAGVSSTVIEAMVKTSAAASETEVTTPSARDEYYGYGPAYWWVAPPPVYYPWYTWYPGVSLDFTIVGTPRTRVWYPAPRHAVMDGPRAFHGDRGGRHGR